MRKSFSNIALYTVVLFASNFVATYLAQVWIDGIHELMSGFITEVSEGYRNVLYFLYYPISFILPFVCLRYVFKRRMHAVIENCHERGWLKSAVLFVMPGEAIRFILCFLVVGNYNMGGYFALIPTVLFDTYWLKWTNRYEAVRVLFQFEFLDCFGYVLCYILYFLPVLFVLGWSFKSLFDLKKAEQEERCFSKSTEAP